MIKLSTLSWGLYLSSSWTWCIGMFLPVILLHRYGWAGYLVFAVPNVIGCTAFGYVMGNAERSRQFVARYTPLLKGFSFVTILFHFYFVLMLLRIHELGLAVCFLLLAGFTLLVCLLQRFSDRSFLWLAMLAYGVSLAVGVDLFDGGFVVQATRPWYEALYLLPLTSIGFLLCPYLDLSFHKALQRSPSKHCFAVFGVSFVAMIAITAIYQDLVLELVPILLMLHLGGQVLFSMGVHAKELSAQIAPEDRVKFGAVLAVALMLICSLMLWPNQSTQFWLDNYLRFFVFYGVLFPATLIAMGMHKKHYLLFVVSVVLALPFLELGVIAQFAYLAIIPALVLIAWGCFALMKGKAASIRLLP